MEYRDHTLHCEGVPLPDIARREGTPCYVYSSAAILEKFRAYDEAFGDAPHQVCYAVKANSNLSILKLLADAGAGFDIVSGGELFRVLAAGGEAAKCTFAGVGKSREEIEYALREGVYSFNVESEAELEYIDRIASEKDLHAPVAFRVNPDVDPATHEYISTGKSENKFGIPLSRIPDVYERAAKMRKIDIVGVPIVRADDGLALSSRNQYLDREERKQAPILRQALLAAGKSGKKSAKEIVDLAREMISEVPLARIDYVALVDAETLRPLETVQPNSLLALAVFFGKTRLIDNIRLP